MIDTPSVPGLNQRYGSKQINGLLQNNRSRSFDLRNSKLPLREAEALVEVDTYTIGSGFVSTIYLSTDEIARINIIEAGASIYFFKIIY